MRNWKFILLLSLLCTFGYVTYAKSEKPRKGIELSKDSRSKVIFENKKIRISFVDSSQEAIKGRYSIINDSIIEINKEQYTLSSISSIQHRSVGNTVSGSFMAYYGTLFTILGAGLLAETYSSSRNNYGGRASSEEFYASAAIAAVGILGVTQGIIYLSNGRKYKLEGNWTATIVNI